MKEGENGFLAELSSDEMERLQREGTEEKLGQTLEDIFFTAIAIEERKKSKTAREITCLYGSGIL